MLECEHDASLVVFVFRSTHRGTNESRKRNRAAWFRVRICLHSVERGVHHESIHLGLGFTTALSPGRKCTAFTPLIDDLGLIRLVAFLGITVPEQKRLQLIPDRRIIPMLA